MLSGMADQLQGQDFLSSKASTPYSAALAALVPLRESGLSRSAFSLTTTLSPPSAPRVLCLSAETAEGWTYRGGCPWVHEGTALEILPQADRMGAAFLCIMLVMLSSLDHREMV